MKRIYILVLALVALTGCATRETQITQIATIDSLLTGVYDGVMPMGELLEYGDLGIGTVDGLDGELIIVDGKAYHIKDDGKAYRVADATTTPFASVTNFSPNISKEFGNISSFAQFESELAELVPNNNIMVAFRMRGTFKSILTRSVPKQEKPYKPLIEVTKYQPQFLLEGVTGELVGFRLPPYISGINVPAWHLHFITEDFTVGGHVLAFELIEGSAQIAEIYDFRLILPKESEAFKNANLSVDRSEDLHKVESAKE